MKISIFLAILSLNFISNSETFSKDVVSNNNQINVKCSSVYKTSFCTKGFLAGRYHLKKGNFIDIITTKRLDGSVRAIIKYNNFIIRDDLLTSSDFYIKINSDKYSSIKKSYLDDKLVYTKTIIDTSHGAFNVGALEASSLIYYIRNGEMIEYVEGD